MLCFAERAYFTSLGIICLPRFNTQGKYFRSTLVTPMPRRVRSKRRKLQSASLALTILVSTIPLPTQLSHVTRDILRKLLPVFLLMGAILGPLITDTLLPIMQRLDPTFLVAFSWAEMYLLTSKISDTCSG